MPKKQNQQQRKLRKYATNIQMSLEKIQLAIYNAIFATNQSNVTKNFLWRVTKKVSFTKLNW